MTGNKETNEKEILNLFSQCGDWESRYQKIIDLGKDLQPLPEELKTEEAKVRGCQSQVWLHARRDGKAVVFQGDSDSVLVKGLVALVIRVYSGKTPDEIMGIQPSFIKDIGLDSHLSPSRANGLVAMLKQIKNFAVVFKYMDDVGAGSASKN